MRHKPWFDPDAGEWHRHAKREPGTYHVFPLFGPEHETDSEVCWCMPEVERVGTGAVVVHRVLN